MLEDYLEAAKIVPVVVLDHASDAVPLCGLLRKHGINIVEITFRSSAAADAIALLRESYADLIIGAGTVLKESQVELAKRSGADFIVTPGINIETLQACVRHDIPVIPGISRPSDVELALNHGVELVKFFPAEASGGPTMLKALLGPYPMLRIMPTGGISLDNIRSYLDIPQVLACGGSWMVDRAAIFERRWVDIEQQIVLTQKFVSKIEAEVMA